MKKYFEIQIGPTKLDPEILESLHNNVLGTLYMYLHGHDVKDRLSVKTWYSHRNQIKPLGIDIGKPIEIQIALHEADQERKKARANQLYKELSAITMEVKALAG